MKLSEAIKKVIGEDQHMGYFISNRLINLSKFASYIRPNLESMTGHFYRDSAIIMALSRYQKKVDVTYRPKLKISELEITTELATMSFDKDETIHEKIQSLFNKAVEERQYFTISESNHEITIISKQDFLKRSNMPEPKYEHFDLSAITVQFERSFLNQSGVVAAILQRLSFQRINLVEIASTCTELTCYIEKDDMKLAFDTLHSNFM